jgi:hypothetical protein
MSSEPNSGARTNPSSKKENDSEDRPRSTYGEIVLAAVTGAMLLTYFTLTYFSCKQMSLTEATLHETEKELRVSQRAWVISAGCKLINFEVNQMGKVSCEVRNNGHTPSVHTVTEGAVDHWITGETKPVANQFKDRPPGGDAVRPDGGIRMKWNLFIISTRDIQQLKSGKLNIRPSGKVFYDDVFGHHHWATFCGEYEHESEGFVTCDSEEQAMDSDPE